MVVGNASRATLPFRSEAQHDPSPAHSTASKPPLAGSNAVQVLPPSKEMSLPVGPTASAMRVATEPRRAVVLAQPAMRVVTGDRALHEGRAGPVEARGVLGRHEAPRAAAVAGDGEGVDRLTRRGEVAADGEAVASVAEGQREDATGRGAEHRGGGDGPGLAEVARVEHPGLRASAGAEPEVVLADVVRQVPLAAKANSPSSAAGIPALERTCHERPPSCVAMMRNLPSGGSLSARPWRASEKAMQS